MNSSHNNYNTRPVNSIVLPTARIDDDVITEINSDGSEGVSTNQTVVSESWKSVFSKLNKINTSVDSGGNDNGSRQTSSGASPIIIGIPNSSSTSTLGEKNNSPTTSTDVYENNETNINNYVLDFFWTKYLC